MKWFKITLIALLTTLTSCHAAYAQHANYDETTHTLTISGVTTNLQALNVYNIMKQNNVANVVMYGPGGDAYAAIRIGRVLTEYDVTIIIPKDKHCFSGCAFAALASNKIIVDGGLWLHRPYSMQMPAMMSPDKYAQRMAVAVLDMQQYLQHIGYEPTLMKFIVENTSPCLFVGVQDIVITHQELPVMDVYDNNCKGLNDTVGY